MRQEPNMFFRFSGQSVRDREGVIVCKPLSKAQCTSHIYIYTSSSYIQCTIYSVQYTLCVYTSIYIYIYIYIYIAGAIYRSYEIWAKRNFTSGDAKFRQDDNEISFDSRKIRGCFSEISWQTFVANFRENKLDEIRRISLLILLHSTV